MFSMCPCPCPCYVPCPCMPCRMAMGATCCARAAGGPAACTNTAPPDMLTIRRPCCATAYAKILFYSPPSRRPLHHCGRGACGPRRHRRQNSLRYHKRRCNPSALHARMRGAHAPASVACVSEASRSLELLRLSRWSHRPARCKPHGHACTKKLNLCSRSASSRAARLALVAA